MSPPPGSHRSLRILTVGSLYPPYHLGGYELVWQAAVWALRGAGHEVRVLATGERLNRPEGAPEDDDVHRDLRWYWQDHAFPRLTLRGRWQLERHNHDVLRRHLVALRPDIVSWWAMGGMSLGLIEQVRRLGLPALGWVNDDWLLYGPTVDQWLRAWRRVPLVRAIGGMPTRVQLDRAAPWVFCSAATRDSALRRHPELAEAAVLHQGVSAAFQAAPERPWSGQLIYAGRIDERKGLGTLIDAVAELPELELRIVGDGDQNAVARLRARAARAGRRIRFEAGTDRRGLARAYAGSDAVVFPVEWFEPWGLVPLEAMAVGRPVVATGMGGSAEYLRHETNALLFEPGNVGALQDALRRVAADPALRARLRSGGLATARRLPEEAWTRAVVARHEAVAADRAPVRAAATGDAYADLASSGRRGTGA